MDLYPQVDLTVARDRTVFVDISLNGAPEAYYRLAVVVLGQHDEEFQNRPPFLWFWNAGDDKQDTLPLRPITFVEGYELPHFKIGLSFDRSDGTNPDSWDPVPEVDVQVTGNPSDGQATIQYSDFGGIVSWK